MDGIVILNKPCGISSNTACRKVGKIVGEKKVGHLGTLDPMAEGVLPVALGKCTKLFDYYLKKTKIYIADFTFGYETTTIDREGEKLFVGGNVPNASEIEKALEKFKGVIMQIPPRYSAKKVNGQRAYELARNDVEFELMPKEVTIYCYELLQQIDTYTYQFLIECSAGTYIRSLARDLAYSLNTYATMTKLKRISCGEFKIEDALTFEDISEQSVISPSKLFSDNVIELDETQCKVAFNTGYFNYEQNFNGLMCLVCCNGTAVALAMRNENRYKLVIRFSNF